MTALAELERESIGRILAVGESAREAAEAVERTRVVHALDAARWAIAEAQQIAGVAAVAARLNRP